MGEEAAQHFGNYIKQRKLDVETVASPSTMRKSRLPIGHKIFTTTPTGGRSLSQIVLVVPHPESFFPYRTLYMLLQSRTLAVRERLLDYAPLLVHGTVDLPSLLTKANHYYLAKSGLSIPRSAFETFDPRNGVDGLSPHLTHPKLRRNSIIVKFVRTHAHIKSKLATIQKIMNSCSVKPRHAAAFWASTEARAQFGPYAVTYGLIAKREVQHGRHSLTRTKQRRNAGGTTRRHE